MSYDHATVVVPREQYSSILFRCQKGAGGGGGGRVGFRVRRICGKIVKASVTSIDSWQLIRIQSKVEWL